MDGNFLGSQAQEKAISEETRKRIDDTVRGILSEAYANAKRIITSHKDLHERIARDLFEKEEMLKEEFDEYFEGVDGVPEKIIK